LTWVNIGVGVHHTWTDEQMAQFRAFYLLGTKQRVAIAV
jgi:hypothetical protein